MAGVAVGDLLQVVLVIFLGFPVLVGLGDLSDDGRAPFSPLIKTRDERLGRLFLGGSVVEDRGAVGRAFVVALAVLRRRVVHAEVPAQELLEGKLLRVVDDARDLGVAHVVAVGRVLDRAAGVADFGADHTRDLAQYLLHAPEAAARQLDSFGFRLLLLLRLARGLDLVEQGQVLGVALSQKLVDGDEAQGRGVDAEPQATLVCRAVVENVSEVAVAVLGAHLGADHAVLAILLRNYVGCIEGLGEAGPARAGVELVARGEQGLAAGDIDIDAGRVVVPVGVLEWLLGGRVAHHGELLRGELLLQFLFRGLDIFHLRGHLLDLLLVGRMWRQLMEYRRGVNDGR